jgi:endonuclease/exonuclease/phosphatase family metal-dependent hydrolase
MRLATFNCENLFARYNFKKNLEPKKEDGFTINDLAFDIYDETEKKITAEAIRKVKADIIALEEVESLPLLDKFNTEYLDSRYKHRILIDSHDPRGIDVAVLSTYPIFSIRSYRHERNAAKKSWLFSRDCLEVTIDVDGKILTLYVNHFKSMIGGRDETRKKRIEQSERVANIIDEQWGTLNYEGNFVVLGDFNDYPEDNTSLASLLMHPGLYNVIERLPEDEQWTHYYSGNEYRQLDYLLISKSLAALNQNKPVIIRNGLPYRATRYTGERFANVGNDNPKASDHAPFAMDLELI